MAREGLRTLVVARKRLSEEHYADFEQRYQQAKISLTDRNTHMQAVVSSILESDLELLGLTGVEDKLQDDVKNTLEILRNAGIKIWMLTGDKVETATNIAISSKLVSRNQSIHHIQKLDDILEAEDELDRLVSLDSESCLIVDGTSLQLFVDHFCDRFVDAAVRLPAVVCCRCSPTQKAVVTEVLLIEKLSFN